MSTEPTAEDEAAMNDGVRFAMDLLKTIPRDSVESVECHITGVLIVFWAALRGTFGDEYSRGFIESQLRSMEPGQPCERYTKPAPH